MNEAELFENIVWRDGGVLCEPEERDEFGDQSNGAEVGKAEPGDENVGII